MCMLSSLSMKYKSVKYRDITVQYLPHLDGGGMGFGQEFLQVVKEKFGKVNHVFEFCSGPGFIGFSLLANKLCNRLTLADINPEAFKACEETIKKNSLQPKVSLYLSDCLDTIPETEHWDLVVSNPPHWPSHEDAYREDIKMFDPNLSIHEKFYRDIKKFLKHDGSVLFQENGRATTAEEFIPMIRKNDLQVIDIFTAKPPSILQCALQGKKLKYAKPSPYYFIWSKPR